MSDEENSAKGGLLAVTFGALMIGLAHMVPILAKQMGRAAESGSVRRAATEAFDSSVLLADDAARSIDDAGKLGLRAERPPVPAIHLPPDEISRGKVDTVLSQVADGAENRILRDFSTRNDAVTQEQIARVIREELSYSAQQMAATKTSGVEFEVLTGKLKITSSYQMGPAKISFGEVNLYKVSAVAASAVVICRTVASSKQRSCIDSALRKAFDKADATTK